MLDTTTKQKFRLIKSNTLSAIENMEIDKVLFESFTKDSMPIFRIYSWYKSCTIGISQKFNDISNIQEYKNNYAKRITGGGVLFHGDDISYSLIIPTSFMKNLSVKKSYEKICSFLLEFYKELGLNAIYAKDNKSIILSKHQYCQVGFEEYDIVINSKKLGGNAQRRNKNIIFQHGSIGLKKDKNQKELGCCLEDFGITLTIEQAQEKLIKAFEITFNVEFKG